MLGFFIILSLIKWIPGLIFQIRYRCRKRSRPLNPSPEEQAENIADMKLRIFDIIKHFEDDFTFNIKESFQEAANYAEAK